MRCWGSSSPAEAKHLEFERSDCVMDSAVYVNDGLITGTLAIRHEAYEASRLGALRFARMYSDSFRNETFRSGRAATAPRCKERFVDRDGLVLRSVVCLAALKRFEGLYNVSVLTTTVDHATQGVQGRLDARGVDFAGAMKLAEHYLQGFALHAAAAGPKGKAP
jgi:serine protease Do